MNLNPESSSTTGSGSGSGPSGSSGSVSGQRKERGAIAAQACENCRSRKQKCDEQRPKCGLCTRMKAVCLYREPQPTKKDKTLVEILDRLKILETKVDRIPVRPPVPLGFGPLQSSPSSQPSFVEGEATSYITGSVQTGDQPSPAGATTGRRRPFRHASAAYMILTWPAIQQVIMQADPSTMEDLLRIELEGSAFIVGLQKGIISLPLDESLTETPFMGMQMQATRTAGGLRSIFPDLTKDVMNRLATSYFDTFNYLYPFMDRQTFLLDTIPKVHSEGFNGDSESVVALLVFALGELAINSTRGEPVSLYRGRPSGLRGGSIERPPGLALFNEARKRMGFVLTGCDLENVQIFSLAALYYGCCSRHVDLWRMTVSASLACQVLITSNRTEWTSPRGDLIKRCFWHCVIMEAGLHLELDLPLTGLINMEYKVGIPIFTNPFCEADHNANIISHFEAHFAAQIALRSLCADLHRTINESASYNTETQAGSTDDYNGPPAITLKELSSNFDRWRGLLPGALHWREDDPMAFPSQEEGSRFWNQHLDPSLSSRGHYSSAHLFTTDLDHEPPQYPYLYDVQVALMRTRYYYAKYVAHIPFVYKALHYPEQFTQEDADGAADCLKACLKWPIILSPPSRHKRLIPYLFSWSQNFLGILLIFHMTHHSPILQQIRQTLARNIASFEEDTETTITCMLDWIRDLKDVDPLADWCWGILRAVYGVDG